MSGALGQGSAAATEAITGKQQSASDQDGGAARPDGKKWQTRKFALDGEFVRFLLVGGFSALVNIVSRFLLSRAMPFEIAVPVAYVIGMATAFALMRRFVFGASGRKAHDEFVRFAIVNLVAVVQVWIVSVGLVRFVFPMFSFAWHPEDIAHIVGVSVPVASSYFGHRHFSFARRDS